ncbi:glycosyltransferase [Pseudomonas anguilliseptica]|uniref:Glycosyltransferase involved in cell wall bisynthesis n=1 Tax=Pseudomonas anguilliseptica TaxID=53406 RepID=A0A1H5ARD3_PSEAG|nr:glycosyltransferase [Pseudomonas anguilliseptica]SED44244.1 Glycosyltransferase involved in cell wall bisynthesis [Pseudomonas anguilliseptica]
MKKSNSSTLLVAGVHQSTDAYPNTLYRVCQLRSRLDTREVNFPMWSTTTGGWKSTRSPIKTLWRAITSHLQVAWAIGCMPHCNIIYIPYPAPLVTLLAYLLPHRPRRIIVDGFISLYDTVVNDRKLWSPNALLPRLLYKLERHAFIKADIVLVDTSQNAQFYSRLFNLPPAHFFALPLATNEIDYIPTPYSPSGERCRVLFIGTLVPLHGICTIIEAARRLASRQDVEFQIIGDGADAPLLQAAIADLVNVTWQRRWYSAEELASEIKASDICLGVFGDTDKTQRVCPYKIYSYSSIGRAIITGNTDWLQSAAGSSLTPPFLGVPVNNPSALADAIAFLADAPLERIRLAESARSFYATHLSNAASMQLLERLLFTESNEARRE